MKPNDGDVHVLTGCYVLDALPEHERRDFERHLKHCASCAAEVRGLRETAARLAIARAVQPPARLQQQVLAATYQTRQLPPPARERFRPGHRARAARLLIRPLPGERRGRDQRRALGPRLAAGTAAVAVAIGLSLGITQAITRHQSGPPSGASAAVTQVITAPDARVETMRASVGGTVTLVASARQRAAVVTVAGMPLPPAGRVYQVWVMTPSGARSAGLLQHAGRPAALLASQVWPGDRIGITVEPSGGTTKPTTPPVVVMPLPA